MGDIHTFLKCPSHDGNVTGVHRATYCYENETSNALTMFCAAETAGANPAGQDNSSGCLGPSQMALPTVSHVALAQEVRPRSGKGSRDNGGTVPSTHPSLAGGRMHPSSHTGDYSSGMEMGQTPCQGFMFSFEPSTCILFDVGSWSEIPPQSPFLKAVR